MWLFLKFMFVVVMGIPFLMCFGIVVACVTLLYEPAEWAAQQLERFDIEELNALEALGAKKLE